MRSTPLISALALGLFVCSTGVARPAAADDDLTLEQLPPAVQDAVKREVGDGRIEDIERDRERGKTVFEVEYIRDNIEYEADFGEDGELLSKAED